MTNPRPVGRTTDNSTQAAISAIEARVTAVESSLAALQASSTSTQTKLDSVAVGQQRMEAQIAQLIEAMAKHLAAPGPAPSATPPDEDGSTRRFNEATRRIERERQSTPVGHGDTSAPPAAPATALTLSARDVAARLGTFGGDWTNIAEFRENVKLLAPRMRPQQLAEALPFALEPGSAAKGWWVALSETKKREIGASPATFMAALETEYLPPLPARMALMTDLHWDLAEAFEAFYLRKLSMLVACGVTDEPTQLSWMLAALPDAAKLLLTPGTVVTAPGDLYRAFRSQAHIEAASKMKPLAQRAAALAAAIAVDARPLPPAADGQRDTPASPPGRPFLAPAGVAPPAGPDLKSTYDPSYISIEDGKRVYRHPAFPKITLTRPCGLCGLDHFNFEHDRVAETRKQVLTVDVAANAAAAGSWDPGDFYESANASLAKD